MMNEPITARSRFFIPEVVQTSETDCGPASLKAALEGFRVPVSYGRLREACQTDVDGTSINTIEELAQDLGLDAAQIMIPVEHMLMAEASALPAIAVVKRPGGETHFVVVWRRHGGTVQVMDPATGRRWPRLSQFLNELYVHEMPVPAAAWRRWAGTDDFLSPLRRRLRDLALTARQIEDLFSEAQSDSSWNFFGVVDAGTRMVDSLVRCGGLRRGQEAARFLAACVARIRTDEAAALRVIPATYWTVRPAPDVGDGHEYLLVQGAILVRLRSYRGASAPGAEEPQQRRPLSPEQKAALTEPPARPTRDLLGMLQEDGLLAPSVLVFALALAAVAVMVEALLFRSLIDVGDSLGFGLQRVGAGGLVVVFLVLMLVVDVANRLGWLRMGRHLEIRLRMAFLSKIPRLHDRYFHSRPKSDMAERGHSVHAVRMLPALGSQCVQTVFTLCATAVGIVWLDPSVAPLAVLAAVLAVVLPLMFQPILAERDLRLRTHAGALSRFYLDAMIAAVPIRAHGAQRAVRREHESLLVEWVRTGLGMQRAVIGIEGLVAISGFALAAWILMHHIARQGEQGSMLLAAYWALHIPQLGQMIAQVARQYPSQRNIALRLIEPLGALENVGDDASSGDPPKETSNGGEPGARLVEVGIEMTDVSVRAAGHTILESINVAIEPGSHVAIVGPSGAGKSTLVGLLLGWHRAAGGSIRINGKPLTESGLVDLRRHTAWVDPAVQLWNRSLLDNLRYGIHEATTTSLTRVLDAAELRHVLEALPEGFQTTLGEGGAFLSGGEGQRVRLARGLLRPDARLVILDEAFRGLDRQKRRVLLARARAFWRDATLLCISHDLHDTKLFDRVLVVEDGHIVEDGSPDALGQRSDTRFRAMLDTEQAVREQLWASTGWRRLVLDDGRMSEMEPG